MFRERPAADTVEIGGIKVPVANLQQILSIAKQTCTDTPQHEQDERQSLQVLVHAQLQGKGQKVLKRYVTHSKVEKVEKLARILNLVKMQGGQGQWTEAVTIEY
jgi:hypothetical protein